MSADNTVVVLMTRRRDRRPGTEFRVAYLQAAERLVEAPDYPSMVNPKLNRGEVRRYFAESDIFFEMERAFDHAQELEKQYVYVEYGIRFLDYRNLFFPAGDRPRQR